LGLECGSGVCGDYRIFSTILKAAKIPAAVKTIAIRYHTGIFV